MIRSIAIFLMLCLTSQVYCQKFTVEKSVVQFYSDAAIEDIKAVNTRCSGLLNIETNEVVFAIPIKDFEFDKALMKEHFNEKYLESEKYPKAFFQGKLLDLRKDVSGKQSVRASGKLTIHGVTKEIEIPGTIELNGNHITARSRFIVQLEDYKIKIPKLLWQNIAEQVELSVDFIYKPL